MEVKNIILPEKIYINPQATFKEVVDIYKSFEFLQIPVVTTDGMVEGVINVKALLKVFFENTPLNTSIKNYVEDAIIIDEDTKMSSIIKYPLEKVVVVDKERKYLGMISQANLFKTLLKQRNHTICELNAILDGSNSGIIAINIDGKIISINKTAGNYLSVAVKDAIGKHIENVIPNTGLLRIIKNGEVELGQRFVLGEKTFITNRSPIVQNGKPTGAVAIFQDITELQNAMEELTKVKEYQNILETVLDHAYDGILVVNAEGIITMYNKEYEDFLQIPREKVIGKHVTEAIENTRMHIVLETGIPEIGHVQQIRGHEMVCMRIPIKKNGRITGVVGKVMFKDLKELKALADKLSSLEIELEYYKDVVKNIQCSHYSFENIIGSSPNMLEIKNMARKVARNNSTVLIRGESGTGKELFAHAIHQESCRKNGPFIKVNCSAIPDSLLESELFGYDEGAFTGAKKGGKLGKFELANKGTIFLDEIGDMPLNMQVKLLRVLQEKEIERVGGNNSIPIDVRIIAATNRPLEDLIKDKKFRLDLYYRLNVVELKIPALRFRKEDIPDIIFCLLKKISARLGCTVPIIEQDALNMLINYNWPGNIRELENILERCLNFIDNGTIKISNIPFHIRRQQVGTEAKSMLLKDLLDEAERIAIVEAIKNCNGNKFKAAKMLGISRAGIYQKIEKYGIE